MPRAVDPRNIEADYDPTRSGTEFGMADFMLSQTEIWIKVLDEAREQAQTAIIEFIKTLTGLDLTSIGNFFDSIFDSIGLDLPGLAALNPITLLQNIVGAFQGIDITDPGSILAAVLTAVRGLINALIGGLTGSISGAGGLDSLAQVLTIPLGLLGSAVAALEQLQQQVAAGLTGQQAQITALRNSIGVSAVSGGFDDFNRTPGPVGTNWTNVDGALTIQPGGFVRTNAFAAGLHTASPASDKHGVAVKLTSKYVGTVRAVMCSNDAMTNYVAIEARVGYFGDDYVRIVTGSSTRVVVSHRQADFYGYQLPSDWVFSMEYDPATNAYTAFKNGEPLMDPWVDTDNVISHGTGHRRVGIVSNADDAGYIVLLGGIPAGFGITDFTFYDRPTT